ncbi:MAG: peptidase M50 [Verrucomicrobia bacterium]|jgi:Zn-dependent protease|nr:MAG: peptidase M50 [Verrucomicrobiota bacterium]PYM09277.1 MAG: peptidase M50 [Verrucomicrobiota bacterium]
MRSGVIRLFRFAGIEVFLHFSWFLVAAIYISGYIRRYESPVWGVLEYISVFVIVLIHEFGHALACRQVGGIANRIVLWPLGGIAFVDPPRRPGAYLWSIAAGPLVNVILLPVLAFVSMMAQASLPGSDVAVFFRDLNFINAVLLGFNLLPIFPLDGGQIVRGLLWFPFGEIRSLQISSVIGLVGGAILGIVGLMAGSVWWAVLAFFLLSRAWYGWQQAKAMIVASKMGIPISPSPTAPENPVPR